MSNKETRDKIKKAADTFIMFVEKGLNVIDKLYKKPIERKKRQFYLRHNEEMTEEEIRFERYQLTKK